MEENNTQFNNSEENENSVNTNNQSYAGTAVNGGYYTYIPYGFTPQTYKEKRKIRKESLRIGITLIVMIFINLIFAPLIVLALQKVGFSYHGAYSYILEPARTQCIQIAFSIIVFLLPTAVMAKICGKKVSSLVPLEKPIKGTGIPFFLFGIACCALANIYNSYMGEFFEKRFHLNYNVDNGDNPQGFFGFMLVLISTAVIPPLVEEFAFRGIILSFLKKFGAGFAIVTSSVLFGLIHGNFSQMPFAFTVGLSLAYITVKTGSIIPSIAVHAFNNLISVVFSYLNLPNTVQNIMYSFLLLIMLLCGIVSVLFILKKDKDAYKIDNADLACGEKAKFKWFFTSPAIIIYTVLCCLLAIRYFFV